MTASAAPVDVEVRAGTAGTAAIVKEDTEDVMRVRVRREVPLGNSLQLSVVVLAEAVAPLLRRRFFLLSFFMGY